ncbi:MAG: LuxR family transcriptional regulator [Saprospiraceae bacterium]|nr:LuxR family transcriptional regulator [Saprospiraceae bacterium]
MQEIEKEYVALLQQQHFDEDLLDYAILKQHLINLEQMAQIGNTGITVFDMYQKRHVFTSYNFESLFGHDLQEIARKDVAYFNSRIHPQDLVDLSVNGIGILKFFYGEDKDLRKDYKLITEYRILNAENKYIRVIEQHQALETDRRGNLWLSLSIVDISPNQDLTMGIKSQLINFRTGSIEAMSSVSGNEKVMENELTTREKEILQLVHYGYLSKEISDRLSISIHTVNTHRQRILEKLGADNSIEAIGFAKTLGLLA